MERGVQEHPCYTGYTSHPFKYPSPQPLEGDSSLSLCSHTHLEVLEFSSKSLETGDALWSHLHDVAVGSWSWLIGSQELGI